MGRAYSDDLRMRILEADERGEGSCRVLAKRFGVSWEYVRKLRRQQVATGQKARIAQSRYGIRSKVTDPVKTGWKRFDPTPLRDTVAWHDACLLDRGGVMPLGSPASPPRQDPS